MATDVAEAPEKSVKRIGWGLLFLALASPVLMASVGVISAGKAGELTAQVGFAWLPAAILIDLILKRRDPITKANGRIVAAALALLMALTTGFTTYRDNQKVDIAKKELIEQFMASTVEAKGAPAQPVTSPVENSTVVAAPASPAPATPIQKASVGGTDADKTVVLLGAMKLRAKQFAETSGALDRKFNALDLATVLAPQNLLTTASIQASRKTLDSYKGLIRERGVMLNEHLALTEQIIRGAGLSERELNSGLAGLNSSKGPTLQIFAELDAAQLNTVKATTDVLNFAERNLGKIVEQSGQLMFQAQSELDEYQRLMTVINGAATKEEAVTKRANALSQRSKQALVDQLK